MPTEDGVRLEGDEAAAALPQVLADRRELAFVAMELTRMPMTITNPRLPDNPIVLANQAFLDLTGYSSEEVLGRNCRFLQGAETDRETVQRIREAIGAGDGITLDVLNHRKDGSTFWNELKICPVHDLDGNLLYHFASQLDVTEKRRVQELEAAERLLLLEIEHRAKNALALVQGIVRLSRADTVEEFAQLVQGRVDALSNAHSVLARGRWHDVPLCRLLEAEITALADKRVVLDGPAIDVAAAQVQPWRSSCTRSSTMPCATAHCRHPPGRCRSAGEAKAIVQSSNSTKRAGRRQQRSGRLDSEPE